MEKIVSLILLATAGTVMMSEGKWMTGTSALVAKRSGTVTDLASIYHKATKHPAIGNKRRHHTGRLQANGWTDTARPTADQHPVNNAFLSSSTPATVPTEGKVDHPFHHQRNNKHDTNAAVSTQQQTTPHPHTGMRLSEVNRSSVILIIQCYWCLTRIIVESSRIGLTEEEKQSAFEQLLGKTGRLRMAGSSQTLHESTTTLSPTVTSIAIPIMLSDEEAKRHDRRHAIHHQKKNNKKDHSKRQHHAGRHVCTHEETVTRPIRVVESYCKPAYKSFTQRCNNGTMCTAFRVQYDTTYRTVVKYQTTTEKKHACCPGWTHADKHAHGCLQAVCSKGCKNGGTCVKPNICTCAPGYTGPSCESDLDECSAPGSNLCQQTCINSAGSYQCACHEGFQLQEDRRSCKFRLELVPELQTLLINYESMSKRLEVLEQEPRVNISASQPIHTPPQVDVVDYQSTIANMTDHIFSLEEKLNKLQNETTLLIANSSNRVESSESSNSDSLTSLSEQVAILEERLADCTCTMTPSHNTVRMRP